MNATRMILASLLVLGGVSVWYIHPAHSQQDLPTTFPMSVSYDPASQNAQAHEAFAAALDGFTGLPADRSTFYSGYTQVNGFWIVGWSGSVIEPGRMATATSPPCGSTQYHYHFQRWGRLECRRFRLL